MKFIINWASNQLFSTTPDTILKEIIQKAINLANSHPDILSSIEKDQDALALKKKKIRNADKLYYANKTRSLFCDTTQYNLGERKEKKLELKIGRKRMEPIVVYIFLMIRGYFNSVTDKESTERMIDSFTLNQALKSLGISMPGFTTILENLNAVSDTTRKLIFNAQIKYAIEKGFDNFKNCQIDSTSVKANSEWPTDSGIALKLFGRTLHYLKILKSFGLPSYNKWHSEKWISQLKKLNFKINNVAGKANSKGKIKKYYRQFLNNSKKLHDYLITEKERIEEYYIDCAPSMRQKLNIVWDKIHDDLMALAEVLYYTENRIFHGVVLKSSNKLLSISDSTAAYIDKGNRIPLIGYKPQLARSKNGFVTSIMVPLGNANDSKQMIPVLTDVITRTKVIPEVVSLDDGYSSAKGRRSALEMGVKTVSISGAKGKKITPENDWNSEVYKKARSDRSAVESIIFTLKYMFEFGRLRRREIDNVKAELLEKIIVFNFYRMIVLEQNKEKLH
ncbi:MAG: transposase [Bacteroidota bacterium]